MPTFNLSSQGLSGPAKYYLRCVRHHLCLPHRDRREPLSALIQKLQPYTSYDAIVESLGTPKAVAGKMNRSLPGYCYRKNPMRYVFLAAGLFCLFFFIYLGCAELFCRYLMINPEILSFCSPSASIGVIGGADGPTAIYLAPSTSSSLFFYCLLAGISILGFFLYARLCHCKTKLE